MKISSLSSRPLLVLLGAVLASAPLARAADSYRFLKEIPVGGEGGWDYITVDPAAHRVYVTHATKVIVIDTQRDELAGEIADTPGVHGVAIARDLGRGFVSNGRENKVSVFDLATLKTLSKVETGDSPDAILYDPTRKEVYAFNHRGKSVTVFAAESGKVEATIALTGLPEFAQLDAKAGRIYVNIEDKSEVSVIDTKTRTVVAHWPIAPGEGPTGMEIDLAHHRLLVGCDDVLVMMDSATGKVVATAPVGKGVDAVAFDPGTQLAFTSNGTSGTVTVIHVDSPDKLTVVQTLATERGAKTMMVDPSTHKIYLGTAKYVIPPAKGGSTAKVRPAMIPGTFRVLIYGPAK